MFQFGSLMDLKTAVRTVLWLLEQLCANTWLREVLAWANSTQKEVLEQVGQQRANVGSSTLAPLEAPDPLARVAAPHVQSRLYGGYLTPLTQTLFLTSVIYYTHTRRLSVC